MNDEILTVELVLPPKPQQPKYYVDRDEEWDAGAVSQSEYLYWVGEALTVKQWLRHPDRYSEFFFVKSKRRLYRGWHGLEGLTLVPVTCFGGRLVV